MKSKIVKRALTLGLSAAMFMTMSLGASAATVSYDVPHKAMTVDSNLILCAAHAQADASPEIIGLTNTTDRKQEVPADYSLDFAQKSTLIGTFGTDINSSPNPYLYNWAYNSWAKENGQQEVDKHTLGGISVSPTAADTEVVPELKTSRSLYYRPDILVGTNGSDYSTLIADLPENTDSDPNNNYDPTLISYPIEVCDDFLVSLYNMANAAENVMAKNPQKHTRYGDPVEIADNLTKYVVGLQSYVLQQMAEHNTARKTVAIIDPLTSKDGTFYCTDENTSLWPTTDHTRAAEFVSATTDNVVTKLGKNTQKLSVNKNNRTADKECYALSAEEVVKNSDIIITAGTNAVGGNVSEDSVRESLIQYLNPSDTDLINKAKTMPVMSRSFDTVGTIGANSIENLLGMAYWTAFCYPEYVNPVDTATYWYKHFYHVTDNSKLEEIIQDTMSDASKPDGVSATTKDYNENQFQARIDAGMSYYNSGAVNNATLSKMAAHLNHSSNNNNNNNNNNAPKSASDFTDVHSGDWFYDAVDYAVKHNIVNGMTNTTFVPDGNTTRGQFVEMLYRAEGTPDAIEVSPFSDVKASDYYCKAVIWTHRNNIVNGTSATTFSADSNITREQLATMLYRAAKNDGKNTTASGNLSSFSDSSNVDSWASEAVQWAVGNGILNGSGGQLLPRENATRAQVATMIQRYAGLK